MRTRQHYGLTLGILTVATLAFALQQTMVLPVLATFEEELDTSATWATWVLTGFLLSGAVCAPILGKLGDRYGKERLLWISLLIFLLGCIGCAMAPDIWTLIACRVVAGAGAAVLPLSFGIIRDEFPAEQVKVGLGLIPATFGVGGGLGFILSGLIVDHSSWRWIFVVGAAGVAVALVLVRRFVPESPVRSAARIDVPGAVLLSVTLVSLLLGLSQGSSWGWTSPATLGLFATGLVAAAAWVPLELNTDEPLLDIRVFVTRPVLVTNVTSFLGGFALFGSFLLVPRFAGTPSGLPDELAGQVNYGFGASATTIGLYLLPGSLLLVVAGPCAGLLGRRFGSRLPLTIGMVLIALSAATLAFLHDDPWQVVAAAAGLNAGAGLAFAAMAALMIEYVAPTETGIATGLYTVIRMVGAVVGAQLAAVILTASTVGSTTVPTEAAYVVAFLFTAAAAALGAAITIVVSPERRVPRQVAVAAA